jgi:hypothetical protein
MPFRAWVVFQMRVRSLERPGVHMRLRGQYLYGVNGIAKWKKNMFGSMVCVRDRIQAIVENQESLTRPQPHLTYARTHQSIP